MPLDAAACYAALIARDRRFDGVFFIGVRTTKIYCRPICPARTPKQQNVRFYSTAAAAEHAGHRPCLRCRPELAPGAAPVDDAGRVLAIVLARIAAGALDGAGTVQSLAREVELSPRQVLRLVHCALGVTPVQLAQTRRLLLAKQLLTDTRLPVETVASASGFSSVRRFGALFTQRYRLSPSSLRRSAADPSMPTSHAARNSTAAPPMIRLSYRPPLDYPSLLSFFRNRAIAGLEHATDDSYTRLISLPASTCPATSKPAAATIGWFTLSAPPAANAATPRHELSLSISPGLEPSLAALLQRIRAMFDLDCRPDVISAHLGAHPALKASVATRPGLRVPGGFDGFEVLCRAILGQQVSISAARTLAARLIAQFGEAAPATLRPPHESLTHLFPTAARLAAFTPAHLATIGLPQSRAQTLHRAATAVARGTLSLAPGTPPELVIQQLRELRGIGPWTASYVAMRALRWPDAFPGTDLILRRALIGPNNATDSQIEAASKCWSPWRAYAAAHLWAAATPPAPRTLKAIKPASKHPPKPRRTTSR